LGDEDALNSLDAQLTVLLAKDKKKLHYFAKKSWPE
jgi:hypothetical protein